MLSGSNEVSPLLAARQLRPVRASYSWMRTRNASSAATIMTVAVFDWSMAALGTTEAGGESGMGDASLAEA
jgi:hypothetical protein